MLTTTHNAAAFAGHPAGNRKRSNVQATFDHALLMAVLIIMGLGLVMVASASISIADRQLGEPFYYLFRQGLYVVLGLGMAAVVTRIPLDVWERISAVLLMIGLLLLVFILLPGVAREINGSTRWLSLGLFNLQPSEFMKLFVIIYLASYLVRRGDEVRTTVWGFLKPMLVLVLAALLLLLEPDMGAAAVIFATALGMMFLAGVRIWHFGVLLLLIAGSVVTLTITSPYRMERVTAFLNPWADPFNSGFQLTQSLIAFGRGEWFGVGLGGSVQKLFYLPEAHTDFMFAVLAEELGMFGALAVVLLFVFVAVRAFRLAGQARQLGLDFAAYTAYGISLWLSMQAFINIGVNTGVLPTKGLTLPLMSYGGSSMLATCIAVGLLLRVDIETREAWVRSVDVKRGGGR
ncbi:putative lipid II flippase FtsW [Sulfuriflexus sp.]|uniref:putative lipid II flippase FtsW n=1 Tax=Sulfuriflexus sp. TaxID=2015443 RepID=UPI0028CF517D|nr:putative lipid II flippase FtsW [Sulfuriflexus sp.]MDT8403535.1 putative lipid II flippase FtsW [Sulfuriflexus sp.]